VVPKPTKRYRVIANPAARSGGAARRIGDVERELKARGLSYDLVRTEGPGHATRLAEQAAVDGYDVIVAAGGDGTANEVLSGLIAARRDGRRAALGILGIGRGNDFGRAVGVPSDVTVAARILAEDRRRMIDVGAVTGDAFRGTRYFGNCVGVGFDAMGTIQANKLPRLGGFLAYFVAVLRTILLYYNAPLTRLEFGDQVLTQPCILVSVMNGHRLGGGFLMAPEAEPDDGLFDLCFGGQIGRARMLALVPHFVRGTQATQPEVKTARAARVTISAVDGSLPAQADGEILCVEGKRLEIEILPRHLEVVCAADLTRAGA
jgi:YegS/Rv2252/BmrU family lipid kinase